MDEEDFLAAVEADNAAGVEEIEAEVTEQSEPQPQREEPQAQPEPAPVAAVEAEPEAAPAPQHVPLTAMLDERDKRKALEAELARRDALAAQQQPQQVQAPDMFEDPDGYRSYQEALVHNQALTTKLDISEELARDKFGDEVVDQARDWALQKFAARPGFQQEVFQQRNPYRFVVEQYQRDQMASQVTPDDFAQFQAWKTAQAAVQATQPQAIATPSRSTPPRSLASAPSAGGVMTEVAQSDEEIFEETFSKE